MNERGKPSRDVPAMRPGSLGAHLAGRALVGLGKGPPRVCEADTVIRIPPGVEHEVVSLGPEPLRLVIVYSPPFRR